MLRGRQVESWGQWAASLEDVGAGAATPFQSGTWLPSCYRTLAAQDGIVPLPIEITDTASGRFVAGFPLLMRADGPVRVIEFVDFGVTDYNAPILSPDLNFGPYDLLKALTSALPVADVLRLQKMPRRMFGSANPIGNVVGREPSECSANYVRIDGDWAGYTRGVLTKKFRKEMERSCRVFLRDAPDARYERVTDVNVAQWVLGEIETLQEARIVTLGLPFVLNDAPYRVFFRDLIRHGLEDGSVVVTALRSGPDRLVAGLIGIRSGDQYAMIRLGQDSANWSQCSPGKLMIERTMHDLHGDGVRHFDFTIGDYPYKQGFGVQSAELIDVVVPLSMRGRVHLRRRGMIDDVKTRLRRYPRVYETVKKFAVSRPQ